MKQSNAVLLKARTARSSPAGKRHVLRESHAARITDPPAGPIINCDRHWRPRGSQDSAVCNTLGGRWGCLEQNEDARARVTARPGWDKVARKKEEITIMPEYIPSPRQWVRDQVQLYEGSGGTEGTTLPETGLPVIIVTHTGNKTGAIRKTPLMRVKDGANYVLVGSVGGAPTHPVWVYNLRSDPAVEIRDYTVVQAMRVREVDEEARRHAVEARRLGVSAVRGLPDAHHTANPGLHRGAARLREPKSLRRRGPYTSSSVDGKRVCSSMNCRMPIPCVVTEGVIAAISPGERPGWRVRSARARRGKRRPCPWPRSRSPRSCPGRWRSARKAAAILPLNGCLAWPR